MLRQGFFHVGLRIGDTGLKQVFAIGPYPLDLPPVKLTGENQPVKTITDRDPAPGVFKSLLETFAYNLDVQVYALAVNHVEILNPD